jgi:hypothetical protein
MKCTHGKEFIFCARCNPREDNPEQEGEFNEEEL